MKIRIGFNGENIVANPDPAVVKSGDNVQWEIDSSYYQYKTSASKYLTWQIYFQYGTPLANNTGLITVQTVGTISIQGFLVLLGASQKIKTTNKGDYKYGIRVIEEGVVQEDEDPVLRVV